MPGPTIQDVLDRIDTLETFLLSKFLSVSGGPILQENHVVGDISYAVVYGSNWYGQIVTSQSDHVVGSVRLKLLRDGLPGTFTVGIRATSNGLPTGSDLCSGTIDGDTLEWGTSGGWYTILLGEGTQLSSGVQYAIVVRATNGDGTNHVRWRLDFDGGYSGGNEVLSTNSGSNWSDQTARDFMFEEYSLEPTLTKIDLKLPEAKIG